MVAAWVVVTAVVLIGKVAEVCPAATVTVAGLGSVAAALSLVRLMVRPAAGAAAEIVTVPVFHGSFSDLLPEAPQNKIF